MKNISLIKGALLQVTFVATILCMGSCTNTDRSDDSKTMAEQQNDAVLVSDRQKKDAQFLVNAAEINLEEIQLAQLAQQNGRSAQVRELGKMMEDAHTKSQQELSALATSKRITIPNSITDDAKDAYSKLNEASGDDFDETYTDMMVSKHKDAISAYEKATTECDDIDIKNWAIASLPALRTHLNHSMESQRLFENQ